MLSFFLVGSSTKVFGSPEAAYQYNQSGLEKLKNESYQEAISDLRQARRYLPSNQKIAKNLAIAYNNYAFSLREEGQLKLAAEQFERSLYYNPQNAYTLYNLGQVYYQLQKMVKAKECLKKAYSLKPSLKGLKKLYSKVKRETKEEKHFDKIETMHFIITVNPGIDVSRLSYIRTYLEDAYGRIGMFLDYYPKDKIPVVLYSESNYKKLLKNKPHWAMAIFDGKVRIPVDKVSYSDQEVVKIIYHEYAHVLLRDLAGQSIPLWLSEGVASYAEDFVLKEDKSLYKSYLDRFGVISIQKIPSNFTNKKLTVATWLYVQSYLLVDFIVRKTGYSGLQKILDYLSEGKNIIQSLEAVSNTNIKGFQQQWVGYIKNTYGIDNLRYRK